MTIKVCEKCGDGIVFNKCILCNEKICKYCARFLWLSSSATSTSINMEFKEVRQPGMDITDITDYTQTVLCKQCTKKVMEKFDLIKNMKSNDKNKKSVTYIESCVLEALVNAMRVNGL